MNKDIQSSVTNRYGQKICKYEPGSYGAEDYLTLCRKILERR